jgi:hypothetical protein
VKLYLWSSSSSTSSFFQCTTCGPANSPRLKCTDDAATSLQSNAHDADGSKDATARRGNSVDRDLEGAIATGVMKGECLRDSNVQVERDGCGEFDSRKHVQEGLRRHLFTGVKVSVPG